MNDRQQEAATHRDGALLVFAGAGSGKTRVITQRIANLVAGGADPRRVLAVTFTNKAAGEMKERLGSILGEREAFLLTVSTFHALCVRILRQHYALVGRKKNFSIYDEGDCENLLKAILADEEDAPTDLKKPSDVASRIEVLKRMLWTPDTMAIIERSDPFVRKVWARYDASLESSNAFDFADLLRYGTQLVERQDAVGESLRTRYDYVMVDEFQDTDGTQLRFVKALASKGNLCVVGDDDQCIYAWRGAEVENIRGFRAHFPDVRVVKLEQNYRSSKNVIDAAVGVIERASVREPKRMFTSGEPGEKIRVVQCVDDHQEARAIVAEAKMLISSGIDPHQIAVLYRNHTTSRLIEKELRRIDLRYVVHGGFRWFDRAEVRDVLSYFKLITNHESDVDCLRAVVAPSRGVGPKTIGKLVDRASSKKVAVFDAMQETEFLSELKPKERTGIESFTALIKELSSVAKQVAPATAIQRLLDQSGIVASYYEEAKRIRMGKESHERGDSELSADEKDKANKARERAERLQELVSDAQSFHDRAKKRNEDVSFDDYIEAICLRADDREEDDRGVQLMTVHASKGLEFDSVFIPACEDGIFCSDQKPANPMEDDDDRRLMYVAFTRAKKRLYLLHAHSRMKNGKTVLLRKCRFLDDVPKPVLEGVMAFDMIQDAERAVEDF